MTTGADAAALLAAIVESSDDAIVGKALDGRILSWNAAAARIFGWSAEEIVGRNVRDLIPADRQAEEDAIIATISRGARHPTFETVRQRKDGSLVDVAVTVSPVLDAEGTVIGASKIARDISDDRLFRQRLATSEQRFRLLADNMSQLAWIADPAGRAVWFNKRWYDFTGLTEAQSLDAASRGDVHRPDLLGPTRQRFLKQVVAGEDWEDTFPLRGADGEWRWFLSRAKPIRDGDLDGGRGGRRGGGGGPIAYWFVTHTDVTEMRDAEQRIELLLQEVNHRSKNMLAIVQSLARRTDIDRPDFIERLEQRIHGLAVNQDLLVRRAWSSVPVREMVEAQLRPLTDLKGQVTLDGPEIDLSPGAAEALAMAMHEMAVNAVKYGALSVPDGGVTVRWEIVTEPEGGRFRMEWIERGGPAVTAPSRRGFGSRIIVDVPRVKLQAAIATNYAPQGFCWSLDCALSAIG